MFPNASPLETGWTASAVLGVVPAVWLLFSSLSTERRRRRAGVDGPVKIDVHRSIATAMGLFVITGCFCLAGLIAMQYPEYPRAEVQAAALSPALILVLFIVANAAATLTSGYCLYQNAALEDEIREAGRRNRRATDRPHALDGALD